MHPSIDLYISLITSQQKTYGYEYLPLLLSLASPSLALLLPNPLPPSTPSSIVGSKYPFALLRKSLRLLIDDNPEALDEVENDISFVYSGYAPISIRLVQCVAQKGGVLSNPAERTTAASDASASGKGNSGTGKVQAHPIVGWKGFEDVVGAIPGETVDIIQRGSGGASAAVPSMTSLREYCLIYGLGQYLKFNVSVHPRDQTTTTVVFFLGGCTYTEIAALRWVGRQNRGKYLFPEVRRIITHHHGCSRPEVLDRNHWNCQWCEYHRRHCRFWEISGIQGRRNLNMCSHTHNSWFGMGVPSDIQVHKACACGVPATVTIFYHVITNQDRDAFVCLGVVTYPGHQSIYLAASALGASPLSQPLTRHFSRPS